MQTHSHEPAQFSLYDNYKLVGMLRANNVDVIACTPHTITAVRHVINHEAERVAVITQLEATMPAIRAYLGFCPIEQNAGVAL